MPNEFRNQLRRAVCIRLRKHAQQISREARPSFRNGGQLPYGVAPGICWTPRASHRVRLLLDLERECHATRMPQLSGRIKREGRVTLPRRRHALHERLQVSDQRSNRSGAAPFGGLCLRQAAGPDPRGVQRSVRRLRVLPAYVTQLLHARRDAVTETRQS